MTRRPFTLFVLLLPVGLAACSSRPTAAVDAVASTAADAGPTPPNPWLAEELAKYDRSRAIREERMGRLLKEEEPALARRLVDALSKRSTDEGAPKYTVLRRVTAFSEAWLDMRSATSGLEVFPHRFEAALHGLAAARFDPAEFDRRQGEVRQALADLDIATEKYTQARVKFRTAAPLRELAALEEKYNGGDLFGVLLRSFEQVEWESDQLIMVALATHDAAVVRRLQAGEPFVPIMQAWFVVEKDLEKVQP